MNPTLLGFGAMRLPEDVTENKRLFATYLDSGNNFIDTAYCYGGSEEMLKKAMVSEHPRDKFLVSSKLPTWSVNSLKECDKTLQTSLKRMGLDYIDYYMLHSLGTNNEKQAVKIGMYEWIQEMKKKGLVRHIGFSFHDTPELLDELLTKHPEMEFVMLQLNYLDIMRGPSDQFHKIALKHKIPILVMEPVKGGTLASLPKSAEALLKNARPKDSIASWAMRYAASLEGILTIFSGMSNQAQMDDNISTFKNLAPISNEELTLLEKVVEILGKEGGIPCTGCKYCLPECPIGIEIASSISLYNECKRAGAKFNRTVMYNSISEGKKAKDCTFCGACIKYCPQNIDIPAALKIVAKEFAG